ncbi:hypothetical protein HDU85_004541 [Gaertneriomyces sp. JEL0708]|nr:hypothetical protein HDU85_004541 [Gaertneriomyces sp. JEL0708]
MSRPPHPYVFISAPGEPTKQDVINRVKENLASRSNDYAEVFPFNLPDFKVGTLDSLVVLSDDLAKADTVAEGVASKIADNMRQLLNNDMGQWMSNLSINDKSIDAYLKTFQWNNMKYRTDKSLRELTDMLLQEVTQIDTLMKNKMQAYTALKGQLQGIQRKQTGNLAVRSLNDIVKKEHLVLDSEYLTTLIVAVPKSSINEWINSYETLTAMVVPRSTQKIAEDDEFALFTVTVFQRVIDEFTNKAREHRYSVREFKWDQQAMAAERKQLAELGATEREQWSSLLRLCKTNFSDAYACYIHLTALRLVVESVLRYGLPPNFQPMLIKPKAKQERKTRDVLNRMFAKLGGAAAGKDTADDQAIEENLALLLGDKEYSPVVLFGVNAITA